MSREIRITIDDDERFERMKTRKQALDLSWEEVLHRGLRPGEEEPDPRRDIAEAKEDLKRAAREVRDVRGRSRGRPGFDPFDPDSIERFVADAVRGATGWMDDRSWEEELDRVTEAEDAVLVFPFLGSDGEDPAHQIPLRVRLRVDAEGLAVEVVTIRTGKGVTGMNAFDREVRARLIRGLAQEGTALLRLETDVEEYPVVPVLTWSKDGDGRPTVDDVEIAEVRFDGD